MDETRAQRASLVTGIFAQAHELPADQRQQFVKERCAGDAELLNVVEYLLKAYDQGQAGGPPFPLKPPPAAGPEAEETIPEEPGRAEPGHGPHGRIGRYRLLQPIGEGGFGTVYMAEQEHPIRRRVALKIIKAGMDTRQVIARFESERQALAMMDHPNIAKVLDAGATDAGRPYFVMELVKGVPITEYCDREKLGTRQRLELFVPVCQAVQHAHQKGIIHRDLKPSNVLVTLHDGKPVPKVIDFGVAKATQSRLTEKTLFTEFNQLVGTPEYMSPEQAEMSGLDVDTRSDIYSLGVLLYELLTGTTPFDPKTLRSKGYAEIQRVIREVEPPKPSTRVASLGEKSTSVASSRRTDPRKLGQFLRGELDWIVMKCLEKDRTRRYETANGLAMEVQRHLRHEMVLASPPSAAYRLRKFAQRYRHLLGTGIILLVMFLVAVTAVVRYAFQQRRLAREHKALAVARDNFVLEQEKAIAGLHDEQRKTDTDLYNALLRHSEAARLSRLPGYRATVWANLHRAKDLNTPALDLGAVKRQVLACLGDPIGLDALGGRSARIADLYNVRSGRQASASRGGMRAVISGARILFSSRADETPKVVPTPLGGTVYDLEFSPDGHFLALACDQGVAVLEVPALNQYTFYRGQWSSSVAFDPSGQFLASTGYFITLWSMRSNRPVASLPQPAGDQSHVRVAFTADGQLLAALRDDTIVNVWPVSSTPERVQLAGHFGGVPTVTYSRDGRFIASVGKDRLVKIWDGQSGRLLHAAQGHRVPIQTAAFHPDGTLLATGDDGGEILLWDPQTGAQVGRVDATSLRKPWRMHFDPGGRYLLVGGLDGIGAWAVRRRGQEPASAERFFTLQTPNRVGDLAIHPDGNQFAFTHEARLCAYDLRTSRLREIPGAAPWQYFNSLHFAPTGRLLRYTSKDERLGIAAWSDNSRAGVTNSGVKSMAQSSDGRWLATFTANDGIVIFNAETGEKWCELPAGGVEVWTLSWSPDGTRLAASHADGGVSLWNLEQVRARLAEFGISLPSTAAHDLTGATPEPLSDAAFAQIVDLHKGHTHPWNTPTDLETTERYDGPDRFPAPAEDWPAWRGPRGDLISHETSLARAWPEGGPPVLWRASVGLGYSGPVASAGRVYLFSLHQGFETLTAFDALTGRLVWSEAEGRGWTGSYAGTRATPAIDGDAVYTYGAGGVLVRRDLATGRRRWKVDVLAQAGAANLNWGASSSPLVAGPRVYLQGGQAGPTAVAVDKEGGSVAWGSEARGEAGYAQPLLVDVAGTAQLVVVGADAVYGMDPASGKTLWTEAWKTRAQSRASAPTYADGLLLVTDGTGAIMLKLSAGGCRRLWASAEIRSYHQAPILDGGLVFANATGTLTCFNWPDPAITWSAPQPTLRLGQGGSLIRVGDRLVTISEDGTLRLLRADGTGPELISQAKLSAPRDRTFVWPTPLLYGGRLYVRGERELECLDVSASTPVAPVAAGATQPAER